MIVLGIDPGFARCGYGVVDFHNKRGKVLDFGCIEPKVLESDEFKLNFVYDELEKVIKKFSPNLFAIEKVFYNNNAKTVIKVGGAIGVVKLVAYKNGLEVMQYTPLQVKMSLTGYGKADKKQVQQMVKNVFKLDSIPQPDDAADGLAICYCVAVDKGLI